MPIKQIEQIGSNGKIDIIEIATTKYNMQTEAVRMVMQTREHIKLHIHLQESKSFTSVETV